ncbi:MAG: 5'-3' exonuclease [Clostridia bacterium]|nr:5'-3' exonuclease [Clostridia bacterium]
MNKLLLVDGSNLLFQMFFGMPARIVNAQGKAIQGTLGFVGALRKIIRMTSPTHMAVLFDGEHENERTALNADYKANRPDYSQTPEEETPFSQLPDVYAALDYMGIPHAETQTCETDDWMASYAEQLPEGWEMVISSFDSDFFQLISPRVSVLRYRGEKTMIHTPETIREKFGILPQQYADFKSLTGDSADNIRGARHVGPKTAAWLLSIYGSLDGILQNVTSIPKPAIREALLQDSDHLRTNYRLIKLTGAHALPFAPEDLIFTHKDHTTTEILKGIGLR